MSHHGFLAPGHTTTVISRRPPNVSGQQFGNHFPPDVGQPLITSLEPVDEPFVINSQAVHHRGLQVVHVDGVLDDVVTKVVGCSVSDTAPFITSQILAVDGGRSLNM